MLRRSMAAEISPLQKSDVPISLPHERAQRCSASPRPVSWQGKRQRSGPNDRRVLWHCKERSASNGNLVFPCASRLQTVKAARTGKWKVTSLRMRGFYLASRSERNHLFSQDNRSHTDTHAWDRSNGRLHFVHDGLNGSFNIFDFGVQFTNQANRVL